MCWGLGPGRLWGSGPGGCRSPSAEDEHSAFAGRSFTASPEAKPVGAAPGAFPEGRRHKPSERKSVTRPVPSCQQLLQALRLKTGAVIELRGRGGGRGRGFSPWSRPLTSFSRFLSLSTKELSGPSPWPLSHHAGEPVSEETALSPCPQIRAEVIREIDAESQPANTRTYLGGRAQPGLGPEDQGPHTPGLPHSRLGWLDGRWLPSGRGSEDRVLGTSKSSPTMITDVRALISCVTGLTVTIKSLAVHASTLPASGHWPDVVQF